jgi:hypothetical protein
MARVTLLAFGEMARVGTVLLDSVKVDLVFMEKASLGEQVSLGRARVGTLLVALAKARRAVQVYTVRR